MKSWGHNWGPRWGPHWGPRWGLRWGQSCAPGTMAFVDRPFHFSGIWVPGLTVFGVAVFFSTGAFAEDAYDDGERVRRPEEIDRADGEEGDLKDQGLETGGLTAPDALSEPGDNRSNIEKELDKSDEKDSGRGLEFVWLSADVGFQTVGLATFSGFDGAGLSSVDTSGSGFVYGGAGGLRLLYFTLGARFWRSDQGPFQLWSLLGEASLRVPIGKLEPFALVGAGYAKAGGLSGIDAMAGLDLRLAAGLDYYFSDSFSVGAQLGADVLFLKNSELASTGAGGTAMLLLGLHF